MKKRAAYRFAGPMIALLFAGSVINYMDRSVLAVVMPQIRRDLSLSNTQYGIAVNAFLVMYMVSYVLGGAVADRLGCRRTFLITLVFWSAASALHAFSQGLLSLSLFRALLGVGEGMFYPTAIRGATEWFPSESRAKAVGIVLCGLSVGALLAPPVAAGITLRYGWRSCFVMTGLLGLILVPLWVLLHRRVKQNYGSLDPAPAFDLPEAENSGTEKIPLRRVAFSRKYGFLLAARAITDAVWYFYLFWIVGYFQEVRSFGLARVGRLTWMPYLSADLGALAGAWASSALIKRGFGADRSRKLTLLVSALLCVLGIRAYYVTNSSLALGYVSLALFGHLSWSSNLHTAITEIAPRKYVAFLYGATGAAGTLMGAVSQPLIGRAVDRVGYEPVFLGCGTIFAVAAGLLLAAGKIEPIRSSQPSI